MTPVRTSVLIGKRQLAIGLRCLGSYVRFSAEPVQLVLHDDGTLDAEATAQLLAAFPSAQIIRRPEADAVVRPRLAGYPACERFRETSPFGRKLFDTVFLTTGDWVRMIDSDILFMRPFHGLFPADGKGFAAIFMTDFQNAYSPGAFAFGYLRQLRLPARANVGVVQFAVSAFHLDRMEALLADPRFHRVAYYLEQTAWAAGVPCGCVGLHDPQQIEMMRFGLTPNAERVAGHFPGPWRSMLERWPEPGAAADQLPPASFRITQARPMPLFAYAQERLVHRARRTLGRDVWSAR